MIGGPYGVNVKNLYKRSTCNRERLLSFEDEPKEIVKFPFSKCVCVEKFFHFFFWPGKRICLQKLYIRKFRSDKL